MKIITASLFTFVWLAFCSVLSGQSLNDLEAPSELHIKIEGTGIYLIPPSGFELSDLFKGFQNPDDPTSMIMMTSIPGPFEEVSVGFSGGAPLPPGMDLRSVDEVKVGDEDGILVKMRQASQGMVFEKLALIFGDSSTTSVINGIYLADSDSVGASISASISSVYVDDAVQENLRDQLDFTLDEGAGDMVFVTSLGTGLILNRDGVLPSQSPDSLSLVADRSFQDLDIPDKKDFCSQRIHNFPDSFTIDTERGIQDVSIDGLDGCSLFASKDKDPTDEVHLVILFEEGRGYYLLMGSYQKGSQKARDDVQNVIKTFRTK